MEPGRKALAIKQCNQTALSQANSLQITCSAQKTGFVEASIHIAATVIFWI
jgi:hypothetical protein